MIEKVSELKHEPVVGKFYLVECVTYQINTVVPQRWIPVIGDEHSDKDLNVPMLHLHKDIRFIKDADLEPVWTWKKILLPFTTEERTLATVVEVKRIRHRKLMKRKCYRTMADFPYWVKDSIYWPQFHEKYIGRKVLCGRCPHRGMPLESLPQDKDGNVICNGHGLKINLKQEVVVERA